jgi:hypothetical protein
VHLFGREQRESGCQIVAHLRAKYAVGSRSRAVGFETSVLLHVTEQIEVSAHVSLWNTKLRAQAQSRGFGGGKLSLA